MTATIPDYIGFDYLAPEDAAAVKACWRRGLVSIDPAKHLPVGKTTYKRYVFNAEQKARAKERAAIWRDKNRHKLRVTQ